MRHAVRESRFEKCIILAPMLDFFEGIVKQCETCINKPTLYCPPYSLLHTVCSVHFLPTFCIYIAPPRSKHYIPYHFRTHQVSPCLFVTTARLARAAQLTIKCCIM